MKIKKFLIFSMLLVIIAMGAVSASDNATQTDSLANENSDNAIPQESDGENNLAMQQNSFDKDFQEKHSLNV